MPCHRFLQVEKIAFFEDFLHSPDAKKQDDVNYLLDVQKYKRWAEG